jgi:alpha-beta hydrolase superfamily lysophospholipase
MAAVGPLNLLEVLATQEVDIGPRLRHLELYTTSGLVTVLWHGPADAERVVVTCGGAMGSLLGPARGLYHHLGVALGERGIGVLRVGYRRPNDLATCTIDLCAAIELAARRGAERAVTMGHSFGGAIAVRTACALGDAVSGVVTFATQSAGCESAGELAGRPLLLFHGDRDELLPVLASETVRVIAGAGEVVVLPGEGHLLVGAGPAIRERLDAWLDEVLPPG